MAEWRFARGWTEPELERRLADVSHRRRSIEGPDHTLTAERGWNTNRSEAVIAREPLGPSLADGPFARAWVLVESYAFSDPRIVRGHFDLQVPLLGRRMLLEARVLGLRYLGAVVVTDVRIEDEPHQSVRGFRYDTLEGHFERGYEWFLVTKDHRSGDVSFRIEAAWQEGDLPNAWSRLGFKVLARHYQRAWHRLAYQRLRLMLGSAGLAPVPRGRRLVHEGPALPAASVHALGGRRPPPDVAMEQEVPARVPAASADTGLTRVATAPRRDAVFKGGGLMTKVLVAAGLGAVAGARAMLAPALVVAARPEVLERVGGEAGRMLRSPVTAQLLPLLAVGELLADKTPWIPSRLDALPLIGRLVSGAAVGSAVAGRETRLAAAAAGALGALAGAHALFRLRRYATRRCGVPNVAAGLCEDVLVIGAGLLLLRRRR
jgi:uncharacterized membrane protein/uncharacterized protein (UPF0548 family)